MKTDRELLDLAAKAAGMDYLIWTPGAAPIVPAAHRALHDRICWHPLTDDGDALRLAGKLFISIGPEMEDVIGKSLVRVSWRGRSHSLGEYGGGDYQTAMRRAIVRAAAAIGEAMP